MRGVRRRVGGSSLALAEALGQALGARILLGLLLEALHALGANDAAVGDLAAHGEGWWCCWWRWF